VGGGTEEPETTPILWQATFSGQTKLSLSERTFGALLPTNWRVNSLLLKFQGFGVQVHKKTGDYLFDPVLADIIPVPSWIFWK
jgi:hypothetical protein